MKLCECGCGEPVRQHARSNYRLGIRKGDWSRFRPGHFSRTEAHRRKMAEVDHELTKHVGAANGNWRGGRWIDAAGYVVVRVAPGVERREHRVVAEQMLGRALRSTEVVHHKNGDRADNRPENLEVLPSQGAHMRKHMTSEEARARGRRGNESRYGRALLATAVEPHQRPTPSTPTTGARAPGEP